MNDDGQDLVAQPGFHTYDINVARQIGRRLGLNCLSNQQRAFI